MQGLSRTASKLGRAAPAKFSRVPRTGLRQALGHALAPRTLWRMYKLLLAGYSTLCFIQKYAGPIKFVLMLAYELEVEAISFLADLMAKQCHFTALLLLAFAIVVHEIGFFLQRCVRRFAWRRCRA